jgi:glycosyltransferase involved in cell wall biosynthesis
MMRKQALADLANSIDPNLIYLNSVFSTPTITVMRARRAGLLNNDPPVIIAPCGELSTAALAFNPWKKRIFLAYAKFADLYDNVIWKASSDLEMQEIREVNDTRVPVMVAPDLPPREILPSYEFSKKPIKRVNAVKLAFVSRVVPKKNILFLLELLADIVDVEVDLEIVGPREEPEYWRTCQNAIRALPSNVKVNATGAVPYDQVLERLVHNHFFVLPTLNENFGYVFVEALAAGCPLLISDRTMWTEAAENGVGYVMPLEQPQLWRESILRVAKMNEAEYKAQSCAARSYGVKWLANPQVEEATARVLETAIDRS